MIQQTELSGIPTLLAPATGPARAGITFRVGYADEPLARSGITHLIEHLALHGLGLTDYHHNGMTAPDVTSFFSQGSPDSVSNHLEQVCRALTELPLDRASVEADVLRTEADGRARSIDDRLCRLRYGSRGLGLAGYPEWGLHAVQPDDLRAWVDRYFTAGNAVLWFSGMDLPQGLVLRLPDGARQPVPAIPSTIPRTPAYVSGANGAIGWQSIVRRSSAARAHTQLLRRELFRRMRQENGYSYTLATDYRPTSAEFTHISAVADVAEDREPAALGEFLDVLASLRYGALDPEDLAGTAAQFRSDLSDPLADAARLPAAASDLLVGAPLLQIDEILDESDRVTLDDVRRVAEEAVGNALLLTPDGLDADWAGFEAVPAWSDTQADGPPLPAHDDPDVALVIGADAVSGIVGGHAATVGYGDCEAMLAWPDGGRLLVGSDGTHCRIEPTLYPLDPQLIGYVDQRVPAGRVIPMPPRPPDAIPMPDAPAPASQPPRKLGFGAIAAIVGMAVLALAAAPLAIGSSLLIGDPEQGIPGLVFAIILWAVVAGCIAGIVALLRSRRRR